MATIMPPPSGFSLSAAVFAIIISPASTHARRGAFRVDECESGACIPTPPREGQKWKYCLQLYEQINTGRSRRQYCNGWPDPALRLCSGSALPQAHAIQILYMKRNGVALSLPSVDRRWRREGRAQNFSRNQSKTFRKKEGCPFETAFTHIHTPSYPFTSILGGINL